MTRETFRVRLSQLIQKSRKALKLYTNMAEVRNKRASEAQLSEWRDVNARLANELQKALSRSSVREASDMVYQLRDRFYGEWRFAEAELHEKQEQLIELAENAQFARVSQLAEELVQVKARKQATQAAHHELDTLLLGSAPSSDSRDQEEGEFSSVELADQEPISGLMLEDSDSDGSGVHEPVRKTAGAKVLAFSGRRHN